MNALWRMKISSCHLAPAVASGSFAIAQATYSASPPGNTQVRLASCALMSLVAARPAAFVRPAWLRRSRRIANATRAGLATLTTLAPHRIRQGNTCLPTSASKPRAPARTRWPRHRATASRPRLRRLPTSRRVADSDPRPPPATPFPSHSRLAMQAHRDRSPCPQESPCPTRLRFHSHSPPCRTRAVRHAVPDNGRCTWRLRSAPIRPLNARPEHNRQRSVLRTA